MGNQPSQNALNNALRDAVSRSSEIRISVTGRKSGRIISIPIWFVAEADKLYLLPVQGTNTQWYQNVLRNPTMRIAAGNAEEELRATPISDSKEVSTVVEKFRAKYGAADVKKYYSGFDAAVVVHLQQLT
jgi:deazaflavin-dependent oxidoreductase (nitroreductase family)